MILLKTEVYCDEGIIIFVCYIICQAVTENITRNYLVGWLHQTGKCLVYKVELFKIGILIGFHNIAINVIYRY